MPMEKCAVFIEEESFFKSILSKLTKRANVIPIKISAKIFMRHDNLILKFIMKSKTIQSIP